MALDIFEVFGINGQVLKFLVDKDVNNQLSLITTQTGSSSISVANFPSVQSVSGAISVNNLPAIQTVSGNINRGFLEVSVNNINIDTLLATLITVDTKAYSFLSFEIVNGATPLTQCQVQARYHNSGTWNPKTFSATEYLSGSGKQSNNSQASIIEASEDLNVLAASAGGWVEINCSRYESVRIQCRVASGTSLVNCRGILK